MKIRILLRAKFVLLCQKQGLHQESFAALLNHTLLSERMKSSLRLSSSSVMAECETQLKKNRSRTRLRSDFLVDGDNVELAVLSRLAPVS